MSGWDRLESGRPPLRVSELARLVGYSDRWIQKCLDAGALGYVQPGGAGRERRVPVSEATRLARDLRVLPAEKGEKGEKGEL
jgi:excisionase family DNA binding protein